MEEVPYSNREIQEKWTDICSTLSRIEKQTTTTNGRVSDLEKWRYFIVGGLSVLTVVVVPILTWALYLMVNLDSRIVAGISQALSAYEVSIEL